MKRIILVLAVGVGLGVAAWFVLRGKPLSQVDGAAPAGTADAGNAANVAAGNAPDSRAARVFSRSTLHRSAAGDTNAPMAWDSRVEQILDSDGTDAEIGAKLLELFPQLPADQQAELIPQLAARVEDQDYSRLGNILTNAAGSEEVADILLTDLLDRPDKLRLPLLLDVARTPDHPKAEDARDLLEVLLGENYGNNWEQWTKKISEWLASHPE